MKRCSKCGIDKPAECFYKRAASKDGLGYVCKECTAIHHEAWYIQNAESVKKRVRIHQRKYKYGINDEQYNAMLDAQDNKCAICNIDMKSPCVDHDHNTLKVREILCSQCNSVLGLMYENADNLRKAADYLDKHKKETI